MCYLWSVTTGPGWSSGAEKEELDDLPKEKGEKKPVRFPSQGNNLWIGAFSSTSSARRPCTLIFLFKGHLVHMSKFVQTILAPACSVHDFQMCFYPRQPGCCLKPRQLCKLQSLIGLFSPNLWLRGSGAGEVDRQLERSCTPTGLEGKGRSRIQWVKSS